MRQKNLPIKISETVAAKCDAPNQLDNFDALIGRVLAVPHAEIVRREKQYQKAIESDPNKRGPKPKRNP